MKTSVTEHGDSLEICIWARHCNAFSVWGLPLSCEVCVSLSPQCLPLIWWYALPACSSTGVHLLPLLNWYIFTRCPSTGVHLLPLLGCQILCGSPLACIPIFNSLFCLDALRRAFTSSLCSGLGHLSLLYHGSVFVDFCLL